ncbi:hypothetical protein MSEN_14970 [Mycolicibacter senuensis]|uniref:Uncharacterized protein n=1 Tax=Mycolicibacter senuensis TaxID=386913 RepID=A0A7I9XK87_9MYCO|nr:hypothetical protein MSEN_14970 [Mycolicibacter senuensis]
MAAGGSSGRGAPQTVNCTWGETVATEVTPAAAAPTNVAAAIPVARYFTVTKILSTA